MNEKKLDIIFIGGLSNGKIVYDYLFRNKFVDLKLVITYPDNCSKPGYIPLNSKVETIKDYSVKKYFDRIDEINPDYIFVAGWSELLTKEILKYKTIGFHPSKLPYDKGRSVLAWQIEENYKETALSMFYYNEIPDGGNIVAQEKIIIDDNDYISDILDKIDFATNSLMKAYFPLIRQNIAISYTQNSNKGNYRRLRNEDDSEINWDNNAINIYNKIRAISKPYPGAFITYNSKKIRVWKSELFLSNNQCKYLTNSKPGEILAKYRDNKYLIQCKDHIICIESSENLKVGYILE